MGVPVISSITPAAGHTGGKVRVEIIGANFRLPTASPSTGVAPPKLPSVEVEFGGVAAETIAVLTASRLSVTTPIHDPATVDVLVRNIDDLGAPIAGESVTSVDAYEFKRPPLTDEAEFTRLLRNLVLEMRRQIVPEVAISTHTDFDPETGDALNIIEPASLPGIVLVGPELTENRLLSLNEKPVSEIVSNEFEERRLPYTVDVQFTLVGTSNNPIELLNMVSVTQLFFGKNKVLRIDRDSTDPAAGTVEHEIDLTEDGDIRVVQMASESNLGRFIGAFVIRGFDLEAFAGLDEDAIVAIGSDVDTIEVETQGV